MAHTNSKTAGQANDPESLINYVIHQYGLTRDQAREIVREHGSNREMVDAMAGKLRAARKP
jgi:predicted metal-dependent TIM-barrel fold hydrolase